MKKLILIGILAMVLAFSGCDGNGESDYVKKTESTQQSAEASGDCSSQPNGEGLGDEKFPNETDEDYSKRY